MSRALSVGALVMLLVAGACGTDPRTAPGGEQSPSLTGATPTGTATGPATGTASDAPSTDASSSDAPSTGTPGSGASSSAAPSASTDPSAQPSEQPSEQPSDAPEPSTPPRTAVLDRGDTGTKVRELQARLRQLAWFEGAMTGRYDKATARAVKAFQRKRGYAVTGTVDTKTWKKLRSMSATPTKAQLKDTTKPGRAVYRRGSSGDKVRDLQARLKQISWYFGNVTGTYGSVTVEAVKGFQGKRFLPVTGAVDARTLSRLRAMTRTPTEDAKHNRVPKPSAVGLDKRCLTGRALCVSKRNRSLTWVIDGRPQVRVDVRFGAYETPTRNGSFTVGWKSRNHVSSIYHTPMPYAMFFSGGQAVHYSADFAARGYSGASHGCVNVRNLAAIQSLFNQVRVGDKVIVYA